MQVIQDTNAGGRLGAALGTGLQQLAQNKLEQIQKHHQKAEYEHGLSQFFGSPVARLLSNVDPDTQKVLLQNPDFLMQLKDKLAQESGNVNQQEEPLAGVGALQPRNLNAADFLSNQNINPLLKQALSKAELPMEAITGNAPQNQPAGAVQNPQQAALSNEQEKSRLLKEALTSPKQRLEKEKLALEKNKLTSREDLAAWKNTLPYREKVLEVEEASREALRSIKEARELEKNGEFPSQQFAAFLKGADWEDIPGFLSGSAEAFNKILANFQRGAKDIYGGRITNFEMEQFLKTIPTLQHTPEGRDRIWAMMEQYYRGGKERGKLERQIIKENGGKPPQDLHEQVNERFKPIAKHISKKFKDELQAAEKLASTYGSRAGSIAAYGAGKLAGGIPGALKGAAKGALTGAAAGSFIPALGTGTGALIGGGLGALGGAGLGDVLKLLL